MARASKKNQLIEFKGTTLPIVSITVHSLLPEQLAKTADELFGDDAFFDGDPAVLELDHLQTTDKASPDWTAIAHVLKRHGLDVIGVRGGNDTLMHAATRAGLHCFAAFKRPARNDEPAQPPEPPKQEPARVEQQAEQTPATTQEPPPAPSFVPTLIIDRPMRSGQQAYARGGDLVVLAAVNAGAEVIADGSIHIYAPLRGRALAGASGETGARIFTTRFEAELVSIAGVYRTFEAGIPESLAGKPVQVQLSGTGSSDGEKLSLKALKTD